MFYIETKLKKVKLSLLIKNMEKFQTAITFNSATAITAQVALIL